MSRFLVPSLAVAALLAGCVGTGKRKAQSGWVVLDKAEKTECAPWPMREKDLAVSEVSLVSGTKSKGFMVAGQKRDTSAMDYYVRFQGDAQLDPERIQAMELGRNAVPLGGAGAGGKTLVMIAKNTGMGATLEVRSTDKNVVLSATELSSLPVQEGRALPGTGGTWLLYKTDDGAFHAAWVDLAKLDKIAVKALPPSWGERPVLIPQTSKPGALVISKEGDAGKPFKAQWLGTDGTAEAALPLDLPVASGVESWSAAGYMGSLYVAYVDGDSLVGAAELKVATLTWDAGPSVKGTKSSPLKDEHVTQPVFLASAKGLEVLVLKWVDEESTIGRYLVAGGNLGKPAYSGLFPKGTRIVEAFTGDSPDDVFVVTRHRIPDDSRWAFRICEL